MVHTLFLGSEGRVLKETDLLSRKIAQSNGDRIYEIIDPNEISEGLSKETAVLRVDRHAEYFHAPLKRLNGQGELIVYIPELWVIRSDCVQPKGISLYA